MFQTRTFTIHDLQIRSDEQGVTRLTGYASLFDTPSQPLWQRGGAREIIQKGAFTRALTEGDDVRLLINHDPNLVLARSTAGTLKLTQDDKGLHYEAVLPDGVSYSDDLKISLARGDINQNSFGMVIDDQGWETRDGEQFSVVKSVHLRDVSIVTYPAYVETFSELRFISDVLTRSNPTEQERELLNAYAVRLTQILNTNVASREGVPSDVQAIAARARRTRELELLLLEQ